VQGDAVLYVAPDIGEIDFEIYADDPDTEAAIALAQARATELQELLAAQGADVVEARFRDLRRVLRNKGAADAPPRVEIRGAVHLQVRDLSKWRDVITGLVGKPNIDNLGTSFGLSSRAQVERELATQALRDAQAKAENLAAGVGKKLGPVNAVSTGLLRNISRAVGLAPADYAAGSRAAPGAKDYYGVESLRFSQSVDVIYRIGK
jgi:uncharacterized protein YggE